MISLCKEDSTNEENEIDYELFSRYLGRGYDILYGYPFPNNEFPEDTGFREEIFETKKITSVIKDFVCKKDEYLTVTTGINDFVNQILFNVNMDNSNFLIRPFSASTPYSHYFKDFELKNKRYVLARNTCSIYYATFNIHVSSDFLHPDFLSTVDQLPILPDELLEKSPRSVKNLRALENKKYEKYLYSWISFFKKYGTHLLVSARFGSQTLNMLEISGIKAREIKIYNYKYRIGNISTLNVFDFPDLMQELKKPPMGRNIIESNNNTSDSTSLEESSLHIRGGSLNQIYESHELTFDVWKDSVSSHMVPIYLDLLALTNLLPTEKRHSFDYAISFYNDLFGITKESLFLSQRIDEIFFEGHQVIGSSSTGPLTLQCPSEFILLTGFIFSFDKSQSTKIEINKNTNDKEQQNRIHIHPCLNENLTKVSCSFYPKQSNTLSFGWIYCSRKTFLQFETLHKNVYKASIDHRDIEEKGTEGGSIIRCSSDNILAFGFQASLERKNHLDHIYIKECPFGEDNCMIKEEKNHTDYILFGFCIPSSIQGIQEISTNYLHKKNVETDMYAQCSESPEEPLLIGFTFSFDDTLENVLAYLCTYQSKQCENKLGTHKKNSYVGMFLVCKSNESPKQLKEK